MRPRSRSASQGRPPPPCLFRLFSTRTRLASFFECCDLRLRLHSHSSAYSRFHVSYRSSSSALSQLQHHRTFLHHLPIALAVERRRPRRSEQGSVPRDHPFESSRRASSRASTRASSRDAPHHFSADDGILASLHREDDARGLLLAADTFQIPTRPPGSRSVELMARPHPLLQI